ncbi:hypothetical protein FRC02_010038 [Tulasnella sp. 418]|nr:hypothetical protein FRC02_010038 [Tulasnella sp. 418]
MSIQDPPLLKGFDSSDNPSIQRQIDAGNMTFQDISKFNDPQWQSFRNYPSYGFSAGAGAAGGYLYVRGIRAPSKIFGLLVAGGLTGFSLGSLQARRTLKKNLQSLDNPDRFSKAMGQIIREKMGKMGVEITAPPPMRKRPGVPESGASQDSQNGPGEEMMDDSQAVDWGKEDAGSAVTSTNASAPSDSQPRTTTWDLIRAARSTAQPTSWDTIRQSHEKQRMTKQPSKSTPSRQSDEMTEQEKFDAMLDAERRAAAENTDPYASSTPTTSKRWT